MSKNRQALRFGGYTALLIALGVGIAACAPPGAETETRKR
jgi:hypothetical protein